VPPVSRTTKASPEQVFRVLSAPPTYALWVVGSRSVESHDDGWPDPGSRFEHTQGQWPVIIHDETESAVSEPPRRLELIVKARPVLVAHVILTLEPQGAGTRIVMEEKPISGLLAAVVRHPPGALLTQLRNRLSLRRLSRIAEAVAAVT
jgi:uncharacterized protein YndB with AHSA1/START domain